KQSSQLLEEAWIFKEKTRDFKVLIAVIYRLCIGELKEPLKELGNAERCASTSRTPPHLNSINLSYTVVSNA
ncbi:hypothetical protein MKX03_000458, partial [Papaver bracteatum]